MSKHMINQNIYCNLYIKIIFNRYYIVISVTIKIVSFEFFYKQVNYVYSLTIDNVLFQIQSIDETNTKLYGHGFLNALPFFEKPIDSRRLGIYMVDLSAEYISLNIEVSDVQNKCVVLPFGKYHVFIPLVHTICMNYIYISCINNL